MVALISILFSFILGNQNNFDAQLKKYLDEKLSSYSKYEFQIVQLPKNYKRIEINDEKNFRLNKNYAYVPVKVYDAKNLASSSLLTVRVKLYKTVYTAAQDIPKNENLSANFLMPKLDDISMSNGSIVSSNTDVSNYRSKILIKEGTVLTETMIELVPTIFKGDSVILHTIGNGVDISIEAVARQDGHIGEIISVYVTGSKLYKGKIIDKKNLTLVE